MLKDEPKGFREKFLKDPKAALMDMGVELPDDYKVTITKVPEKTLAFHLPEKMPEITEVSDEELEKLAGGLLKGTGTYCYTPCDDCDF